MLAWCLGFTVEAVTTQHFAVTSGWRWRQMRNVHTFCSPRILRELRDSGYKRRDVVASHAAGTNGAILRSASSAHSMFVICSSEVGAICFDLISDAKTSKQNALMSLHLGVASRRCWRRMKGPEGSSRQPRVDNVFPCEETQNLGHLKSV